MKKHFILLLVCLWGITSMGWSAQKTTFEQISYKNTDAKRVYIYKGGTAFHGFVWSEDGKSVRLQTNEYGLVTKITMYHSNGRPCMEAAITREGDFRNPVHYDMNGYHIDGETWEDEYENYFLTIWYMIPEKLRRCLF